MKRRSVDGSRDRPARREIWVRHLIYPLHTVPTALAPALVAAGLAIRDGVFAAGPLLAAIFAGWLVQVGGVVADNESNLRRHADDREHPELVAAIREGTLSLAELKRVVRWAHAAAVVVGAWLVWIGGVPALVLGLASIAASRAYSSDPWPLGDHALGDTLFFLFFGLVSVVGTYYVQAAAVLAEPFFLAVPPGSVTWEAVTASLPVAGLTTGILVIDNIRDLPFDREKDEVTLAVLVGPTWSVVEHGALLGLAYVVPVALWAWAGFGLSVLLPLLTIPFAVSLSRDLARASDREALIPMTPRQGRLLLAHSALFGLGLAL